MDVCALAVPTDIVNAMASMGSLCRSIPGGFVQMTCNGKSYTGPEDIHSAM